MSRLTVYGGGGGTSPLTAKGDLYGYTTQGARVPVGVDGQTLVADSTQAPGVSYAYRRRPMEWIVGTYLTPDAGPLVFGTAFGPAPSSTTLYLAPVDLDVAATIDRLGIGTKVGVAGAVVRLGLFTVSAGAISGLTITNVTVTRVLDGGTATLDTAGLKTVIVNATPAPNRYWIGMAMSDGTAGCYGNNIVAGFAFIETNLAGDNAPRGMISIPVVAGDITGGFAASYGPTTASFYSNCYRVGMRRAS